MKLIQEEPILRDSGVAPPPSTADAKKKFSIDMPLGEFQRFQEWCDQQNITVAEGARRLVHGWLDEEGAPP